jgi:hypothetical protein
MGMLDESDGDWWETMRLLFGWKNVTSYDTNTKQKFYKEKKPMSDEEKSQLVPVEHRAYMDSWVRSHERTIRLCHEQYGHNQKTSPLFLEED